MLGTTSVTSARSDVMPSPYKYTTTDNSGSIIPLLVNGPAECMHAQLSDCEGLIKEANLASTFVTSLRDVARLSRIADDPYNDCRQNRVP